MTNRSRRREWARWSALLALLLVVGTACASSGSGERRGSRNVLTHEVLVETEEPNLLLAVQRLRPEWLRARAQSIEGAQVTVFVDGAQRGGVDQLRDIQILNVRDVTFLSASEAGFRYGTVGGTGGVIEVRTRR